MRTLERLGLQAAAEEVVETGSRARRMAARIPVMRSGTPLELVESSWIAEGVSRLEALSVPAIFSARNLIVGTIIQLELYRYRGGERLDPGYLLTKPDPSTIRAVSLAGTVDDLLFRGRAYWRVLERDSEGFPTRARWVPVDDVTPNARSSGGSYSSLEDYSIAGERERVPVRDVIRFDSPIPGVLEVGGRTLAAMLELENAARRLSAAELPAGVLTNEGQELSADELDEAARRFAAQRRELGVAALQGWSYDRADLNAADLQLVDARAAAATEAARLGNVPVAMIGASPSGNASALLYSNLAQQLAILVVTSVGPWLVTIEQTLSDVIPRGQTVAFDRQTFIRSDPQAAADYALALLAAGVISVDEARGLLGIPPTGSSSPDLTPGRV